MGKGTTNTATYKQTTAPNNIFLQTLVTLFQIPHFRM